jgi:Transglutaminase-like superfamily
VKRHAARAPLARWAVAAGLSSLVLGACATTSSWTPPTTLDTRDDPATVRPGYGNDELHTWWPLTAPEIAAARGLEAARRGDAHALLALGLASSGDRRDDASHADFTARVDRFLIETKPAIDAAADDWHRGYELNRAMHRTFFGGERTDLGSYELDQARLTGIFTTGHYNCLSSAVLYVVLARAFGLPVRAVVVPTHVFVEMGDTSTPGAKIFEIETTSDTGFDWVHDARFYREAAVDWSRRRGLRPVTFDEYQRRKIIEPYQLMALAMRDGRSGEEKDRGRLHELAALVDPGDVEVQRERLQLTNNDAIELYNAKAWRTMTRLFDVVSSAVEALAATTHDPETAQLASWATWYHARALMIVGRTDEAMARTKEGYARLDATWSDADKLREDYAGLVIDRLCGLIDKKDYGKALEVYAAYREPCRAEKVCAGDVAIIYANQSIDAQNAGDWQAARQALQQCVAELPGDAHCKDALADLESQHRF